MLLQFRSRAFPAPVGTVLDLGASGRRCDRSGKQLRHSACKLSLR